MEKIGGNNRYQYTNSLAIRNRERSGGARTNPNDTHENAAVAFLVQDSKRCNVWGKIF